MFARPTRSDELQRSIERIHTLDKTSESSVCLRSSESRIVSSKYSTHKATANATTTPRRTLASNRRNAGLPDARKVSVFARIVIWLRLDSELPMSPASTVGQFFQQCGAGEARNACGWGLDRQCNRAIGGYSRNVLLQSRPRNGSTKLFANQLCRQITVGCVRKVNGYSVSLRLIGVYGIGWCTNRLCCGNGRNEDGGS